MLLLAVFLCYYQKFKKKIKFVDGVLHLLRKHKFKLKIIKQK